MAKLFEIELEVIDGLERTSQEIEVYLRHLLHNSDISINLLDVNESERKVKDW